MALDFGPLDSKVALFSAPNKSPNVAAAFEEVKKLLVGLDARLVALETEEPPPPQPTGTLRYRPPALTSPQSLTITQPGTYNLGTGDWYIDIADVRWSSFPSGRSGIFLNGGRNLVVIGGNIEMTSTNTTDDSTGILVDGGVDGGIVHLEGLNIKACNGITVRTRRRVQIQNCRITVKAYNDIHGDIHPDIVQVWGTSYAHLPCAGIYMHKVTGFTTYTGLVCLVELAPTSGATDPLVWERWEVDLHPNLNSNGTKDAGNYAYMSSRPTSLNNGPYCEYRGEVYAELPTGGGGWYVRGIDDIVILKTASPNTFFPYEIRNPAGSVLYTSPDPPAGGSGRAEAKQTGNYLTFARVPRFANHKWIVGKPSVGEFVPASVPGVSYQSPGYL